MKNKLLLGLDTNIFIYYFQDQENFGHKTKPIFESLAANQVTAVTSILTQVELLSYKKIDGESLKQLQTLFLEVPNLKIESLTAEIAFEAARIRREYGLRTPDAIQLATAIKTKADMFVTNDKRLNIVKEIKITFL